MGKPILQLDNINQSSLSSSSINHFSHPHPLQLSQPTTPGISCSGCNLEVSGMVYSCTLSCNYFLHKKCSEMPKKITHPYDQHGHVLSLLAKPVYPEGIFTCDACGQQSPGFCYHCKACGIDLHILCASSPLTFMHQFHQHQLQLTFSPPYPSKSFTCNICRMNGSNVWFYHCNLCQFNVHLSCLNKQPCIRQMMTNNPHILQHNSMPRNFTSKGNPQPQLFSQHSMPINNFMSNPIHGSPFPAATAMPNYGVPMSKNFVNNGGYGEYSGSPARTGRGNGLLNEVVGGIANGIASGASGAIAGALIGNIIGGGNN